MQKNTMRMLQSVLRSDPPTEAERTQILRWLGVSPQASKPATAAPSNGVAAPNRILRRAETARVLSRSLRAVDRLAADGHLKRVHLPGRERGAGFLESEVLKLIAA